MCFDFEVCPTKETNIFRGEVIKHSTMIFHLFGDIHDLVNRFFIFFFVLLQLFIQQFLSFEQPRLDFF